MPGAKRRRAATRIHKRFGHLPSLMETYIEGNELPPPAIIPQQHFAPTTFEVIRPFLPLPARTKKRVPDRLDHIYATPHESPSPEPAPWSPDENRDDFADDVDDRNFEVLEASSIPTDVLLLLNNM